MTAIAPMLITVLALTAPLASANVTPPARSEHEWAMTAVRAGEILPLTNILKRMEREFVGQVVEIELERENGLIVYEIALLTPKGHVIELYYDARTGALVSVEGQDIYSARRQERSMTVTRP